MIASVEFLANLLKLRWSSFPLTRLRTTYSFAQLFLSLLSAHTLTFSCLHFDSFKIIESIDCEVNLFPRSCSSDWQFFPSLNKLSKSLCISCDFNRIKQLSRCSSWMFFSDAACILHAGRNSDCSWSVTANNRDHSDTVNCWSPHGFQFYWSDDEFIASEIEILLQTEKGPRSSSRPQDLFGFCSLGPEGEN